LARTWHRWKFHLSALVLLVPLGLTPTFFAEGPDTSLVTRSVTAGGLVVDLAATTEPPYRGADGRPMKDFNVILRPQDIDRVRAAFLHIGKPRLLRAAGALSHGNPYRGHAHVPIPDRGSGPKEVWLTLERWDGRIHQASVPLAEFLGDQG
jgi:hypothetical protein